MVAAPTIGTVLALVLGGGIVAGSTVALAQRDGARGRQEAQAPSSQGTSSAGEEGGETSAEEEVESSGGEKVKVFKFGGLDIQGELKSPQLMYFLNRLRAEFERPRLPHRSFMPELIRSSRDDAL